MFYNWKGGGIIQKNLQSITRVVTIWHTTFLELTVKYMAAHVSFVLIIATIPQLLLDLHSNGPCVIRRLALQLQTFVEDTLYLCHFPFRLDLFLLDFAHLTSRHFHYHFDLRLEPFLNAFLSEAFHLFLQVLVVFLLLLLGLFLLELFFLFGDCALELPVERFFV